MREGFAKMGLERWGGVSVAGSCGKGQVRKRSRLLWRPATERMARVEALKGSWDHIVKSFTFLASQGLKAARSSRAFCAGVWGAMEETVKIG